MSNTKNNLPAQQEASPSVEEKSSQVAVQHEAFSGPIPPPTVLEGYDRIIPGAAERILTMAEEDARHQREMEREALRSAVAENRLGQHYGLGIAVLALTVTTIALFLGYEKAAMTVGGTTVVGLATVFVVGRLKKGS